MKKNTITISVVLVIIATLAFSLLLFTRFKESNSWELAKSKNSKNSYEIYLKDYPNGKYKLLAERNIEDIAWIETVKINTIDSYNTFIAKFPKGKNTEKADSIRQELLWARTISGPKTDSAYIDYMNKYPQGKYKHDANKFIVLYKFEINRITDSDVPEDWSNINARYYAEKEDGNKYIFRIGPDYSVKNTSNGITSYPQSIGYAKINDQIQKFNDIDFKSNEITICQNDDYKITTIINPKLNESIEETWISHGVMIITKKICNSTKRIKVTIISSDG